MLSQQIQNDKVYHQKAHEILFKKNKLSIYLTDVRKG